MKCIEVQETVSVGETILDNESSNYFTILWKA